MEEKGYDEIFRKNEALNILINNEVFVKFSLMVNLFATNGISSVFSAFIPRLWDKRKEPVFGIKKKIVYVEPNSTGKSPTYLYWEPLPGIPPEKLTNEEIKGASWTS